MSFTPTWATGFARDASESELPEAWDGVFGSWAPALGNTGAQTAGLSRNVPMTHYGTPATALPIWGAGKYGSHLSFAGGSSQYAMAPVSGTALVQFSIELLFRPTADMTTKGAFQWANGLGSTAPFVMVQAQNVTTLRVFGNNGYFWTGTIATGTWYHLVITHSGTVWNVYFNGVAQTPYTGGRLYQANGTALYIGNAYNGYATMDWAKLTVSNRCWSPQVAKALAADPLASHRLRRRVYGFYVPAGGGGGGGAWWHRVHIRERRLAA